MSPVLLDITLTKDLYNRKSTYHRMKRSFRAGFNFGLTSGVITTLGLMVGLNSITNSKFIVIGGVLTIAFADALSDAVAIHIAVESQDKYNSRDIWETTLSTFVYKFVFASMFIPPLIFFELPKAVAISALIGLYVIFVNSLIMARLQDISAKRVIGEHMFLTIAVIIASHYIGIWISSLF